MGDVAILVPVLEALFKQNKNVRITILTQLFFAPIFKDFKNITVYPVDKKGKHKGFLGLFKLYKELKPLQFTAIADIHNVLRSNVLKLLFFNKKCIQIDKGRKEKKELISKKNFKQLKTSHERYADVFRKLGFTIDLSTPVFLEKKPIPTAFKNLITSAHKTIGIAPFAAHKSKMYPLDQMKIVVEQLSKDYTILLFGGKSDVIQLETLQTNQNIYLAAGKLSFTEELNTISNLDCMISMDSGNAHLAAMYGIKVITIWGVTHPFAGFAPFHQPTDYAMLADADQYPKIPTSIYGNKYPEDYLNCSESIAPEQIIEKVKSIL
ncbi:glycosyltransferase family 9 protein [Polaribacter sp. MSW13]|uniref:Glycosyltransferase family 9 protein n=2 Tax=Polaribacter marinus TaxID=2916838 RepID=A0A9X1VME3_9FLAO|nr:glycosyltransferase family 9 protein [Polaribacter marinus]MCI2228782.1 glycosyltransferase family 9 protein [Polaribacter marinus]